MRRRIQMQPPGVMYVSRPQRVKSTTCPKPQVSVDGAVLGNETTDLDFASNSERLSGQDLFVLHNALETGVITEGSGLYYEEDYD